jgi:hypothetical protein
MRDKLLQVIWIKRIVFFFPFQLVAVHVKKNPLLLFCWLVMFGFVTGNIAPHYGVQYLFLNPEYRDHVSFLSFYIVGFSFGGFTMAFNIVSYIMNSFRFPFLATLANPFQKYCYNNLVIPVLFVITYLVNTFQFLKAEQTMSTIHILFLLLGFLMGAALFIAIAITYFIRTNKNIQILFGYKTQEYQTSATSLKKNIRKKKSVPWKNTNLVKEPRDWYVETYIGSMFKLKYVRPVSHYQRDILRRVFRQNHGSAARFQLVTIVTLIIIGWFQEISYFMVPAAGSLFLVFTLIMMLSSTFYSWLRGWTTAFVILLIIMLNLVFRFTFLKNSCKVYGLNYDGDKALYTVENLYLHNNNRAAYTADSLQAIIALEKWKQDNTQANGKKPKMIFINTSGGGLRSSLWTLYTIQKADSTLKGTFLRKTKLITGSSGGMIGAAFIRELYLQKRTQKNINIYDSRYCDDISKDILNPVTFNIATNELFLNMQKFKRGKSEYSKDRAYAFERRLNQNTGLLLDKPLKNYQLAEFENQVPMMIFSPTILNDGRKLLISPQPISYLTNNNSNTNLNAQLIGEAVEYTRFFEKQDAMNTGFLSVLRMNATFPYISPVVTLPSEPIMDVMDAGMRDNFGMETTLKYIAAFRNWIEENTSGIIIVQIRDRHKELPTEPNPPKTMMGSLLRPIGSLYGNLFIIQDYNQDQLLHHMATIYKGPIEVVNFQMENDRKNNISLSWHLTNREKIKILKSIHTPENQASLIRLKQLTE